MLPIASLQFNSMDGAIQQRFEILKQRLFQKCDCDMEEQEIIGKSSDIMSKDLDGKNIDPGRYGMEYHLEGIDLYL